MARTCRGCGGHEECVCKEEKFVDNLNEQAEKGIKWLYPEDDPVPTHKGAEIVAEFVYNVTGAVKLDKLKRRSYGWNYESGGYYGSELITIIAYIPYTPPTPPEKPQDCPFCGGEMKLRGMPGALYFSCQGAQEGSCLITPERKTKAEAIKALNSIRVVSDE